MPPSDNFDGNAGPKTENDSRESDNQNMMSGRATRTGMNMSPPGKRIRPKPAYLSSKEPPAVKSFSAVISDKLEQSMKRYFSDKNSFCNTVMLLCTLLLSLLFSLFYQMLEISNVLQIQLLPSFLVIRIYQLFAALISMPVKILIYLKHQIWALSTSTTGKREKIISGTKD